MPGRLARHAFLKALEGLEGGHLTLRLPEGETRHFGTPPGEAGGGLSARMVVEREDFFQTLALHGPLWIGESYVAGDWHTDDLPGLIELGQRNYDRLVYGAWYARLMRVGSRLNYWLGRGAENTREGSRKNIQAHYDLGNELFALFLDESLTYSSAIFSQVDEPLAAAQENKYRALAERAEIGREDHVLEIGCGWGGFALFAARTYGCRVTAITISEEQHALATARVRAAGLEGLITVRLCDYRDVQGSFTKIVSIEMLEAVGQRYWEAYFRTCDRVLAPGGRMAIQTIAVPEHLFEEHVSTAHWVQKRIFPGGLLPSLEALRQTLTKATTLAVTDVSEVGAHYARTLAHWRQAFVERWEEARALGYDERFCRMWEFYLAGCEAGFRTGRLLTYQLALTRDEGV